MVCLFAVNVAIAFATKSYVSTFVAGAVFGLLVADVILLLKNRGGRHP
jgi:phosphotransferase system  glucose/maltose/N-acetylglucosamine-specific IIC component